jgi:hypothetical protein
MINTYLYEISGAKTAVLGQAEREQFRSLWAAKVQKKIK